MKMKCCKLGILLLCVFLLFCSCKGENHDENPPQPDTNQKQSQEEASLEALRKRIASEDKMIAVAYLGWCEGNFSEIMRYIAEMGFTEEYPFLGSMEEVRFAQSEGGELYTVVPLDQKTALDVYKMEWDETSEAMVKSGKLLSETDGMPILIRGNISEVMPNLCVQVRRASDTVSYTPCLSGMDGRVADTDNAVDFSPYNRMEWYAGYATDEQLKILCGEWVSLTQDGAKTECVLQLTLYRDQTALYGFGYEEDELSECFEGSWSIDADSNLLTLSLYGGPVDNESAHYELHSDFLWASPEPHLLQLIHQSGSPILYESEGASYVFNRME